MNFYTFKIGDTERIRDKICYFLFLKYLYKKLLILKLSNEDKNIYYHNFKTRFWVNLGQSPGH